MYSEVFPTRLKKAREYSGLSPNEAATYLKIGQSTYRNYEAGHRKPDIEMIALLSRLFDVTSDWLIGLTSDSGIDSLRQVIEDREREKILKKMEKDAEFNRRLWG